MTPALCLRIARPLLDMADIFRRHAVDFILAYSPSRLQRKAIRAISNCRTSVLGGHIDKCDQCGAERNSYNSCRHRMCPKCGALARDKWLKARQAELLLVHYFHVVFTLPDWINGVALQNQKVVYDILFKSVNKTLCGLGRQRLKARLGYIAVLHTWGSNLLAHPHLHCIIPGGGPSLDGTHWVSTRKNYFMPVKVLSKRFRHLFRTALEKAFDSGQLEFHGKQQHLQDPGQFRKWLWQATTQWVVHAKSPFGGPEQVLKYLGRYTHKSAITNHRITAISETKVTFSWKNYRKNKGKEYRKGQSPDLMNLHPHEFMRRVLLHVLPPRFVRIRYGGFLANPQRSANLALCRQLLQPTPPQPQPAPAVTPEPDKATDGGWPDLLASPKTLPTPAEPDICSACKQGKMVLSTVIPTIGTPPRRRMPPRQRKAPVRIDSS